MSDDLLKTAFEHMDRQDAGIVELMKRNEELESSLRVVITLSPEEFAEFVRQLDDPRPPTKELIELLRRKAPWET
jgi:uncharacterized protein (DUF1778 family)